MITPFMDSSHMYGYSSKKHGFPFDSLIFFLKDKKIKIFIKSFYMVLFKKKRIWKIKFIMSFTNSRVILWAQFLCQHPNTTIINEEWERDNKENTNVGFQGKPTSCMASAQHVERNCRSLDIQRAFFFLVHVWLLSLHWYVGKLLLDTREVSLKVSLLHRQRL